MRELWPEVSVVASHQITREWREYERTSTAVLSAYVQPVAERYLDAPRRRRPRARGFDGQLYVMQSNCGVDSVEKTKEIPITMVESGPASGFWGAAELGRLIGEPNVLALDIGGTTAKCSLIEGGHVQDHLRLLDRAQPRSRPATRSWCRSSTSSRSATAAAASPGSTTSASCTSARSRPARCPGPAAYGRGGTEATTTDANLALGRINRDYFCGGEIDGRHGRGRRARSTRSPAQLGVDRAEAARGIVRIANNNMVNALKLISVNRGYDPRDFTLVAFGGGGGMHAVALAAELGIRKVVDPARRRRLLGLGDADERPAPRLLRHPPDRPDAARTRGRLDALLRRARRRRALDAVRGARASRPEQVALPPLRRTSATRTRSTASRSPLPDGAIDAAAVERDRRPLPRARTSASTPTASTRRSSSSAATSSRSPRSASSSPRRCR